MSIVNLLGWFMREIVLLNNFINLNWSKEIKSMLILKLYKIMFIEKCG